MRRKIFIVVIALIVTVAGIFAADMEFINNMEKYDNEEGKTSLYHIEETYSNEDKYYQYLPQNEDNKNNTEEKYHFYEITGEKWQFTNMFMMNIGKQIMKENTEAIVINTSNEGLKLQYLMYMYPWNIENRAGITVALKMGNGTSEDNGIRGFFSESGRIKDVSGNQWEYVYPQETSKNKSLEINMEIGKIEKVLSSHSNLIGWKGYRKYINAEEFAGYYIVNEVVGNNEAMKTDTYIYKDSSEKYSPLIWPSMNESSEEKKEYESFIMNEKLWYQYLLKDIWFTEKIIDKYIMLRKNILSDENIKSEFSNIAMIFASGMSKEDVRKMTVNKSEVRAREEIMERVEFLDRHIQAIQFISHDSTTKLDRNSGERK